LARIRRRILVVDDEPDVVASFKVSLEDAGFDVDQYTDPSTAISNFKAKHYDLLIIDIRMPQIDGFELFEHLHKIDPRPKVCFITAYEINYHALREVFSSPDETCFLKKPIQMSDLIRRINLELANPQ
jgi:DNA-binding response OmpR family regulator